MRIWIDLANSPHVLFFQPIVRDLCAAGHEVLLTARDFAQTVPLAKKLGLDATLIGAHGGRGLFKKVTNIGGRALALARWASGRDLDLAVSHNSYAHVAASRLIGVPCATLMDYEHQPANHVAFRLASLVCVPMSFDEDALRRCGAIPARTHRYDGLKEEVYLDGFSARPELRGELAQLFAAAGADFAPERHILVTLRTPATMAAYHDFENPLFDGLLARLDRDDVRTVVLPRTKEQGAELAKKLPRGALVPKEPLDGPQLIAASDLCISAGGTMVREAAVLGVPSWSVYAGELGGVDRALIAEGRLRLLERPEDLAALELSRRASSAGPVRSQLRASLIARVLDLAARP
jgi:uncharacterized protein